MTAYCEAGKVAHVMDWSAHGSWSAACWRGPRRIRWADWPRGEPWPIKQALPGDEPVKPWCKYCTKTIRGRVDELLGTVLR